MKKNQNVVDLSHRLPTESEIRSAADAVSAIVRSRDANGGTLHFRDDSEGEFKLSPSLCDLLVDVLSHVSRGEMVTVVSNGALLSTQQAADLLNVSRPYVSKLIGKNELHCVQVGTHRRVYLEELMRYKSERDANRAKALDKVIELGEELD